MSRLRVNTLKDQLGFFFHYGLTAGVLTGAFAALGSPLALIGIAAGGAYLKRQFDKMGRDEVQAVLEEEKVARINGIISAELKTDSSKSMWQRLGLDERVYPSKENPLYQRAETWLRHCAGKLGLAKVPPLLLMKGATNTKEDGLTKTYNERADVYAFARANGHAAISEPLANALKPEELRAVLARETAFAATKRGENIDMIRKVGGIAKMMAGLNGFLTFINSFKNAGIYAGAIATTFAAHEIYKRVAGLDPKDPADKAKLDLCGKITANATLAGLAVTFGAPDVLVAQAVSIATRKSVDLIEKSYARETELQADRVAAQLTGDPAALCTALSKIVANRLQVEPTFNHREPSKGLLSSFFDRVRDLGEVQPNVERRMDRLMGVRINHMDSVPVFAAR